jgi:hypothetical protein
MSRTYRPSATSKGPVAAHTGQSRAGPKVAKGRKFPIAVSVACWVDLLGYGAMIAEAGFNPLHHRSNEAFQRLRNFHSAVAASSHRHFTTLVMNDGAVAYRDLSMRTRSVTHDFLLRCWRLFARIREVESAQRYPGARMVLAAGFRIRSSRRDQPASPKAASILDRFREGRISAEQAIREALNYQESFGLAPELQANFAFTKAYVADSDGSRAGLGGPEFFVDLSLFTVPSPDWLELGRPVAWRNERLQLEATFAPIRNVPYTRHPAGGPKEIRDALQVAESLTRDREVLHTLREAARTGPLPSSHRTIR